MYEMLAGAPPFEGDTEQDLFNAISYGDVKYPSSLQDDAVDILSKVGSLPTHPLHTPYLEGIYFSWLLHLWACLINI